MHPDQGSGREIPSPPSSSPFCASFVLFCFHPIRSAHLYMYVDNLCILITRSFTDAIQTIIKLIQDFGKFSGLHLNFGKSAVVIQGKFSDSDMQLISDCGISIKLTIRYPGMLMCLPCRRLPGHSEGPSGEPP